MIERNDKKKLKVFIVDDSSLIRKVLTDIINSDDSLEVIGVANNGKVALAKLNLLKPDVITLDIEMPEMDGLTTLKHIIDGHSARVIMVSSFTKKDAELTLKALDLGATDFIQKPTKYEDLKELSELIIKKIKAVGFNDVNLEKTSPILKIVDQQYKANIGTIPKHIIAIGTSTGGPSALKTIFSQEIINRDCAYLVVQHMPETFTNMFAKSINMISPINFKEAENNEQIYSGCGYIAPGSAHIKLAFRNNIPYIELDRTGKVSGHMPSIDVLFHSAAKNLKKNAVAVIMTGMGKDGVEGMMDIKKAGGKNIAQDKYSSVVFGMNKEAIDSGVVEYVVSLTDIPKTINKILNL